MDGLLVIHNSVGVPEAMRSGILFGFHTYLPYYDGLEHPLSLYQVGT